MMIVLCCINEYILNLGSVKVLSVYPASVGTSTVIALNNRNYTFDLIYCKL